MNGINILNQVEITKSVIGFALLMFLVIAGLLMTLFGATYAFESFSTRKRLAYILLALLGSFSLISAVMLSVAEKPTGRYQYEVTIDESVSMTEFYEKYDVVERRGSIWVIEEKED